MCAWIIFVIKYSDEEEQEDEDRTGQSIAVPFPYSRCFLFIFTNHSKLSIAWTGDVASARFGNNLVRIMELIGIFDVLLVMVMEQRNNFLKPMERAPYFRLADLIAFLIRTLSVNENDHRDSLETHTIRGRPLSQSHPTSPVV